MKSSESRLSYISYSIIFIHTRSTLTGALSLVALQYEVCFPLAYHHRTLNNVCFSFSFQKAIFVSELHNQRRRPEQTPRPSFAKSYLPGSERDLQFCSEELNVQQGHVWKVHRLQGSVSRIKFWLLLRKSKARYTSEPSCQKNHWYGDEGGYFWLWYHLKGNTLGYSNQHFFPKKQCPSEIIEKNTFRKNKVVNKLFYL